MPRVVYVPTECGNGDTLFFALPRNLHLFSQVAKTFIRLSTGQELDIAFKFSCIALDCSLFYQI